MIQTLPWYALRVRSNCEKSAGELLRLQGYQELVPLYNARRRWSDRVKRLQLPLFPGYIFCRFDPRERLPILKTPGIVNVLGGGEGPEPVDALEIARIQTIVASPCSYQPHPFLSVGQRVTVTNGPLAGIQGILTRLKSSYRVVVSVNLLQRAVAAEVDESWVEPVEPYLVVGAPMVSA